MSEIPKSKGFSNDVASMDQQTLRILRRLCEAGSVLAVAEGMDTAVVVRENQSGATNKTASVSAEFVAVLALNAWVECANPGRISRYKITAAGRAKLAELSEVGMTQSLKLGGHYGQKTSEDNQTRRVRYNTAESPVAALARRKDKDGAPFLDDNLVIAAERLREDFELAQMGPRVAQNWDNFLTAGADVNSASSGSTDGAPSAARERVAKACAISVPVLGTWRCGAVAILKGLKARKSEWGGPRALARSFCASLCSVYASFMKLNWATC